MTDSTERDWVAEVGAPAYSSIVDMVAALNCDYDRLTELRDERATFAEAVEVASGARETRKAKRALAEWDTDHADELKELSDAAGECESQDDARQRIEEDALSVEVRSGWYTPGGDSSPEEYCLLLSTGGPAVRIVGDLNGGCEPSSARLEVQDWWKPWTEYRPTDDDILLSYARCFCFES